MKTQVVILVVAASFLCFGVEAQDYRASLKCYDCNSKDTKECTDGPFDNIKQTVCDGSTPSTDPPTTDLPTTTLDTETNQKAEPEGETTTVASSPVYQCYFSKTDGEVTRGCTTPDKELCKGKEKDVCDVCTTDLCNSGVKMSGTVLMTTLLGVTLILLR